MAARSSPGGDTWLQLRVGVRVGVRVRVLVLVLVLARVRVGVRVGLSGPHEARPSCSPWASNPNPILR